MSTQFTPDLDDGDRLADAPLDHPAPPPASATFTRPAAPGTPPAAAPPPSAATISPKQVGFAKALARDAGLSELDFDVLVSERYNRPPGRARENRRIRPDRLPQNPAPRQHFGHGAYP